MAETLGKRLAAAMRAASIGTPADLARASNSTTPTISNWLNDNVVPEHVKAEQLFRIAHAVNLSGYELLTGEPEPAAHRPQLSRVAEDQPSYGPSQELQLQSWTLAFQLVAEALGEGMTLPPEKHAEVVLLTHELLDEGMPRAKVLRFVRTAAA